MFMNDKHQKMQNHAQQEISAKLNNSMMFYVYAFHLAVSVGSSYCVIINQQLIPCCIIVGLACLADLSCRDLRLDMRVHHAFIIIFCSFINKHYSVFLIQKPEFVRNVLALEISNIFLISQYFLTDYHYAKCANQVLFVSSFAYVRMYYYTKNVAFNPQLYYFVYRICDHWTESYILFSGLIGIFFLNCYWFRLIVMKMIEKLGFGLNKGIESGKKGQ
jgi:hypothetical protein